jgi:hypothetical protein
MTICLKNYPKSPKIHENIEDQNYNELYLRHGIFFSSDFLHYFFK